jgi:2-C-methyl-D-erythritol 4-phosphate cytidylyltransferase/2-C-methyl-D-erythritol 2,4-cyclodiphosphate synthase
VVETIDRSALGVAQTPQGMRREIWRRAERTVGAGTWTDEAAMLEACRIAVHVVPGDPANIKVTLPVDLSRATASLVGEGAGTVRHGIGQDGHPFGPGTPLVLGGIVIDGAPRLAGHSDGDVVLHAVADALLGAAALGDLGRLFPAGPETPVGIDSRTLLTTVVARVADAGWQPAGIDLTIIGARPRLGPRLDLIRTSVAELVGLRSDRVNVKASTGNLDGSEGAGRSISTLALVTIEARS